MVTKPFASDYTQTEPTFPAFQQAGRIRHIRAPSSFPSLLEALVSLIPDRSPESLSELLELGAIYVNGLRSARGPLAKGSILRVHVEPRRFPLPQGETEALVVAVTEDYVIANKPAGLPTHATVDNARENLISFLSTRLGPLFAVQRLDHQTRGLVLLARSPAGHRLMQTWQKRGLVRKFYRAMTTAPAPLGLVASGMVAAERPPFHFRNPAQPGDKLCNMIVTDCRPVAANQSLYAIDLELLTGRTHQVRGQLASLGAPLWGDELYGGAPARDGFSLTCWRLVLPAPGRKECVYSIADSTMVP